MLAFANPKIHDCSLVIATRDRPELLDALLLTIGQVRFKQILVVDSCPTKPAREVAERNGVSYLCEPMPGASRARNRGLFTVKSEYIIFLEDDAVPRSGWLEHLLAEFDDPTVGVVIGRVVLPAAQEGAEMCDLNRKAGYLGQGNERSLISARTKDWFALLNFGGISLGGLFAVRRSALPRWRGFDERIGAGTMLNGGDEPRAFAELVECGWNAVYTPEAVVEHPVQPRSLEQMRILVLQRVTAATAYLLLLLREEPTHRGELMLYLMKKMRSGTREFSPSPGLRFFSFLRSRLLGVRVYLNVKNQPRAEGSRLSPN
jgi:cellulose synthase/poly-beta-1,6-N-acetylglucosamine synthase-like glycosyltransferase